MSQRNGPITFVQRGLGIFHAHRAFWIVTAATLLALHVALAYLSQSFSYTKPLSEQPVLTMVALELSAGLLFLVVVWGLCAAQDRSALLLIWVIAVGIALRCVMMLSAPMLEYDFYRYFLDGAAVSEGINPYRISPEAVLDGSDEDPQNLSRLAAESNGLIARISFPHLRTIYPPTTQAAFAVAHWIRPWSLAAWRGVLAVFDLATLILLLIILRDLSIPLSFAAIYWWNPLVILETYNTAHMDMIGLPFVLGALFLSTKGRSVSAALLLAIAVGGKLWPLFLFPLVLIPAWGRPREFLVSTGVFGFTLGLLCLPVILSGLDETSGFVAYAGYWEMNDFLYRLLLCGVKSICTMLSLTTVYAHIVTRVISLALLAAFIGYVMRQPLSGHRQLWDRALLIVAAVFVLSPTQFPWYYVWVTPFLAIKPRPSLLLLNCLLTFYYLVYYVRGIGQPQIFDNYIVWLQFLPFWMVVIWESVLRDKTSALGSRKAE